MNIRKSPLCLSIPFLVLALSSGPAGAQLELPLGGWRLGNADAPFTQSVHYPAVTPGIDAATPEGSQIRGRIRGRDKSPIATIIVNGNAMPVRLDESGAFARPYSFGAGSNGVEVQSGDERLRTQFYQTTSGQPEARLRIVLSWDTDGTDLDLHVVTPSGGHAWYGERVIAGGAIDIDVTTGYGPEIFASPAPEKGLYQVYVNYYGSGRDDGLTIARLSVISNEGLASEKRQEFTLPMRFSGELVLARQFMYP
ncbi:MAG: DUF2135 domain-containing protein [Candidatus Accumulibacter sp.]|jgi:uncharacterized protein YfaP (DUF2135 family)|nr:DUF2135 domain-containing protein [Accumulibacter sp.]